MFVQSEIEEVWEVIRGTKVCRPWRVHARLQGSITEAVDRVGWLVGSRWSRKKECQCQKHCTPVPQCQSLLHRHQSQLSYQMTSHSRFTRFTEGQGRKRHNISTFNRLFKRGYSLSRHGHNTFVTLVTETLFLADEQQGQDARQLSANLGYVLTISLFQKLEISSDKVDQLHKALKPPQPSVYIKFKMQTLNRQRHLVCGSDFKQHSTKTCPWKRRTGPVRNKEIPELWCNPAS